MQHMTRNEMDLSMQRVKVYKLNDEGTWDDNGTGHVSVEYLESGVALVVTSEEDTRTLLVHLLSRGINYQLQGEETIITWTDSNVGTDVALSFQEPAGCNFVWRRIQEIQNTTRLGTRDPSSPRLLDGSSQQQGASPYRRHHGPVDEYDAASPSQFDYFEGSRHGGGGAAAVAASAVELPEPNLETLGGIAKTLSEASLFQREALAAQLLVPGFLSRLLAAFRTAEDLEDESTLAAAHDAVKSAILLNDSALLEALFSEEYALDVIGALEYDPKVPPSERSRHREFLRSAGSPKEIIPIHDTALWGKILSAHRMGYVKDVVLPRTLDDATFATLSSLQLFNQVEVLASLQSDPHFFPDLFEKLHSTPADASQWQDLVGFLQEVVGLARHLQPSQRNTLLSKMVDLGLFPVLTRVLQSGDTSARLRAAEVLLANVLHDPLPLRAHLQSDGGPLFTALVEAVLDSGAPGLQEQALEILKGLLDPETMDSSVEKDKFIDAFYDMHVGRFLGAVVEASSSMEEQRDALAGSLTSRDGESSHRHNSKRQPTAGTLMLVLDLLCFCVTQHSYRIKYYILRNNVVEKVLRLLRRKERAVAGAALRFLRTCLAMRDEFYNRYLVKNSLLEPVLAAYLNNGSRYNLFNSTALELFEFIRRENLRGLVAALLESPQWTALELSSNAYVETFKQLKTRYELNLEGRGAPTQPGSTAPDGSRQQQDREAVGVARAAAAAEARRRRGEREEDAEEESYFREDDEDDEENKLCEKDSGLATLTESSETLPTHAFSAYGEGRILLGNTSPLLGLPGGGLVDYGDDEEDGDTMLLGVAVLAHQRQFALDKTTNASKRRSTEAIRHVSSEKKAKVDNGQ